MGAQGRGGWGSQPLSKSLLVLRPWRKIPILHEMSALPRQLPQEVYQQGYTKEPTVCQIGSPGLSLLGVGCSACPAATLHCRARGQGLRPVKDPSPNAWKRLFWGRCEGEVCCAALGWLLPISSHGKSSGVTAGGKGRSLPLGLPGGLQAEKLLLPIPVKCQGCRWGETALVGPFLGRCKGLGCCKGKSKVQLKLKKPLGFLSS